jgi:hypothetical protein
MKQIFDLLKTKVHNIADIQNCGEEDCYPWEKKNCRGCVNRRVSVKAVLKLINEAEAKWEADCCIRVIGKPFTSSCGQKYDKWTYVGEPYCAKCGKPIKISEVCL